MCLLEEAKRRIFEDIAGHKVQYLLLVFFLVVGITAGTFTVSNMQVETKEALGGYAGLVLFSIKTLPLDHWRIFFHAFLLNTLYYGALAFFSMITLGLVLINAMLIMKGFCVGFAVGVLFLDFTAGGILAVAACLLIPNLIMLPCICKAGVLCINHSLTVFKSRRIPSTAHERVVCAAPHFRRLFAVYTVSLLGIALQSTLMPVLMQLIL